MRLSQYTAPPEPAAQTVTMTDGILWFVTVFFVIPVGLLVVAIGRGWFDEWLHPARALERERARAARRAAIEEAKARRPPAEPEGEPAELPEARVVRR